ncbi:MAG: D-alanyl-D-alanine carboxypeptidase/D-alanyl-D-alanine-endopeptidase, partial [Candidatus Eremiobacteraeota bacterium]|nr:D-alanyl-D-alanine carboxypeptidase/D-alanyl-D-alanine-endopeptidase [Candidatus Eremiobacteraeota bacterium]
MRAAACAATCAVVALALVIGSGATALGGANPAQSFQGSVDATAQRAPLNRAQLGVYAVESTTGRVLASHQADREFAPASTFKLLLSAAALHTLGPQYRFKTALLARGDIESGRLDGDLIIVGGGDPTLTSQDLSAAAAAVARAGIRDVRGTLLADATLFDQRRWGPDWAWDGTPFYYEAPIQALSIDEGTVGAIIAPGARTGDAVSAQLIAPYDGYTIASRAVMGTGPYDDPARCSHRIGTTQILIVGRMPLGESEERVHCAVDDTVAFAADVLRADLRAAGVSLGASAAGPVPPNVPLDVIDDSPLPAQPRYSGARVLWSHDSPTLLALYGTMLPQSDNFIAEHMLKMLA